ncbi:substrate-binding domain-containing protein [Amycolatopsis sp.]|uniref:substrate-binding domain-containing protein n=1 Tax=Amycolatopsis sp. TaxID=37632 RepID=UPI002D805D22|nr:substrate-binding domain-containing protein [Amycolatopsis sp.]HET6704675.1 substrate-binding domain-containing protein [Amycolatopsis sp.]
MLPSRQAGGAAVVLPEPGRSIGVLATTLATLGAGRTFDAVAQAAAAEGYTVKLIPLGKPAFGAVPEAGRDLGEHGVDGLVVLVGEYPWDGIVVPGDMPVVVVDSGSGTGYPAVDTDQEQGAVLATEHLLKLGHETVWHVAGPSDSRVAERRERAWRRTLTRFDRRVPLPVVGDWTAESGHTLGRVLAHDPAVTAVFAANDQMALGLLRALHEAGRSVPGEVSVVGFDDMAEAASFWPPLTTIRQSFPELGRRVVRTLLGEIRSGIRAAASGNVPVTLVVRASTGPPPW